MKAVVQRVTRCKVDVDDQTIADIGSGLLILIGAGKEDNPDKAAQMAKKISNLRIFSDAAGKMNLSLLDIWWFSTGGIAIHFTCRYPQGQSAIVCGSNGSGACQSSGGSIRKLP